MAAVRFRAAIWLRRAWPAVVGSAIVVGVIVGIALTVVAGTRRTASAPDRYTERAGGERDLVLTQQAGRPIGDEVSALPGVRRVESTTFVLSFPRSPRDGKLLDDLNPFAGGDRAVGARVVDGRFTDPSRADEFIVNRQLMEQWREQFGTEVGDRFTFDNFSIDQVRGNVDITKERPTLEPFEATLVGVTETPGEFDAPSSQLILSAAVLDLLTEAGVVQTQLAVTLDRPGDRAWVLDGIRAIPGGADAYEVPYRIVSDSARRAVRFQVTALWIVSAIAIVAAAVMAGQVAARTLRVAAPERTTMGALGWRRRDLVAERTLLGAVIGLAAVPVAAAVTIAASPLFPDGVMALLEPDPGVRVDAWVLAIGLPAICVLGALTGAIVGGATRPSAMRLSGRRAAPPLARGGVAPTVGMLFATTTASGRRPWRLAAMGVLAGVGLVGALVAGVALVRIVDTPSRWGINFDHLFGNPYTEAPGDIVTPLLDDPDIDAATGATIGSVRIDGADTATLAFQPAKGDLVPTAVDGRAPASLDEIGLGAEVAHRLHVEVGDDVSVAGFSGESRRLRVVGLVLTPDSAGNGAAMLFESYAALNPGATQNVVLVDFHRGVPDGKVGEVAQLIYSPPDTTTAPVSIRALERVTTAPFLLAALLALMLAVTAAYLLISSIRSRARDLAVLRALGAKRAQLRQTVHWQVTLVAGLVVAAGVPLGVVLARTVVGAINRALGIVRIIDVPLSLVVTCVLAPMLLANLLALLPARRAAKARVVDLAADR